MSGHSESASAALEECKVIRGGRGAGSYHGKQGLDYFTGVSAESAGSEGICMHVLVMPPGAEAKPHYHENHETAIYMPLFPHFSFAISPPTLRRPGRP